MNDVGDDMKPKLSLFYCINAFDERDPAARTELEGFAVTPVQMACSGMVKDVMLLRAFESGADGVVALVCPEEACRYAQGSVRARKRVDFVKKMLDDIGLGGDRLFLFNTAKSDIQRLREICGEVREALERVGPNPAA